MPASYLLQYQAIAQPPAQSAQPGQSNAAPWLYAWSEPVRFKILPSLAVVLAVASGAVSPVPSPSSILQISWFSPLSEPVRVKPALETALQQFDPYQTPIQPQVSRLIQWFSSLSEPVRVKPRLEAALNTFLFYQPEFPEDLDVDWFRPLTEPVRLPKGLRAWLQQTTAYYPRILPNPDVTATMDGIETNEDVALFGINVYSGSPATGGATSANVSIAEIQARNSGFGSIEET